jgi:predicted permease
MRGLRRRWARLAGTVLRRQSDADLADEIDSHVHWLAEDDIRRGVPPDEAYRRARIRFGSVEAAKERYRDQRGVPALEILFRDVRDAIRGIRRSPAFSLVAILSLAIGIGTNTAIFSLVDAVLLRPLAYDDPERIFIAREIDLGLFGQNLLGVNPFHAREWAVSCPSVDDVGVFRTAAAQFTGDAEPSLVTASRITHNLLPVLGVQVSSGRGFRAEEEQPGNDRAVLLSDSFWRTRFNADPAVVGRTIQLDGEPHEVVGIVPASFRLPASGASNRRDDMFRPLVLEPDEIGRLMGNYNYGALVRLKAGATADRALAEMNVVQSRFPRQAGLRTELRAALIPVHEYVTSASRAGLWTLAAAVGAVLLIVCLNLANLLLARIVSRSREIAIRTALGASRGRLFSQTLTESLVLAVAGGAVGLLLAAGIVRAFLAAMPLELPRIDQVRVDTAVLAFACGLTILTGLVFGALPAWRLTRHDPREALRDGSHTITDSRRALRLREALIGLEVGVSVALLIVAGLLGTSLVRLLRVDTGFGIDHVLTVDVNLGASRYAEADAREQLLDRVLSRAGAIPGVEAAAIVTHLPVRGESWNDPIYLEGAPRERKHSVNNRYASPGYFRVMNIAVRQGRAFDESDRGRGVAVLSEKAARILWPDDPSPVGRTFVGEDDTLKTLVGIVADVRAALQADPPATAYYPFWQRVPDGVTLVVRAAESSAISAAIRDVLRNEDSQLPIPVVRSMVEVVDRSVAQRRFQLTIMAIFGVAALLVSSLGIYGVVSYSVARRRNELGLRLALGAKRSRLLGLVIRQGMKPVIAGLVAGVAVALMVGRAIENLLFEVQPADPLTIASVTLVLLTVAVLACLIPARRAATTDALSALRFQ